MLYNEPSSEVPPPSTYLDAAHVWQEDPDHNIPEDERRTICAIACMKIVLDYIDPQKAKEISLHRMFTEMQAAGAQNEQRYWKHSGQVTYLTDLGLMSWRRNWLAPSQDPQYFADNEGYSAAQLSRVAEQIQAEEWDNGDVDKIMLQSLQTSFDADCPVIVSVKPGFSNNKQDHQVVLNGYEEDSEGRWLYFVDPALPPEQHQDKQKVSLDRFLEYSKHLAIFVTKP